MKIIQMRIGTPETFVPSALKQPSLCPVETGTIEGLGWTFSPRGTCLTLPLQAEEELFGFGLQLKSVAHKGTVKIIRPNADPVADTGDSHAPVPFFVSSRGYGLVIDTFRSVRFHCGVGTNLHRPATEGNTTTVEVEDLYAKVRLREPSTLLMDIPTARGVEVYYIDGGSILQTVAAYNLLSGGGCELPEWGLGPQFRCFARYDAEQVLATARTIRAQGMPITMLGLEPGWQTHSYPCSLKWNTARFPDPSGMIRRLRLAGFHVNLWQHAFLDPASPLYEDMRGCCCPYEVWKGMVPDLAMREGRRLFAEHLRKELVSCGVDGFKLDECDGSDYTGGWSYPDCAPFPSGADGEQMHHAYGLLYQQTVLEALDGAPTLSLVRSSGLFASPLPFSLYSDLYDPGDFVRGCINAGYAGLLWAPEVRDAADGDEFIRRLEVAAFSNVMLVNGWYMEELPWVTLGVEDETRELFRLRAALKPYLAAAYARYHTAGIPPVRGLPCDFPQDELTWQIDDMYCFGSDMIVAPRISRGSRTVYLPQGRWRDLWTGKKVPCGRWKLTQGRIGVFVREDAVIPMEDPDDPAKRYAVCFGTLPCASADTAAPTFLRADECMGEIVMKRNSTHE